MTTRIKLRRDTAANWTANNPILAAGEPGVETDTGKTKYGDGTTVWTSLEYASTNVRAREQIGYFTIVGPEIPNNAYDEWFETVEVDPDGNAYYVGGQNDGPDWIRVVKVDPDGARVWEKEIDWADGYEGAGISAVYNTATDRLVVVADVWKNTTGGEQDECFAVITVNPTTGAIVGNPTVVRDDITSDGSQYGWMAPTDIILSAAGTPIVSGRKGGNATLFSVTTQTGSTQDTLFVDAAQFYNRYPLPYNDWYVTGTNIVSPLQITDVNYYYNKPATALASTGTGATFTISSDGAGNYAVDAVSAGGSNYFVGNKILVSGSLLDGSTSTNDATITVATVGTGSVLTATINGTSASTGTATFTTISGTNIASGSNATFTAQWRMQGNQLYFPDTGPNNLYFGVSYAQAGSGFAVGDRLSLPASSYGGSTTGTITVISVGGSGEISDYVFTGTFNTSTIKLTAGTFDFGTTGSWTIQNFNSDAFVWTPDWCVNFGAGSSDEAHALAKDSQGNIYAAARSYDNSIGGEERGVLVKISSTGTLVWTKNFDSVGWSSHNDGYTGVAVDGDDNVIVVQDEQITKVSSTGTVLWQKEVVDMLDMWNACVDVDSDNNIYIAAEYDYPGVTSSDNFLIIKFDTNGNVLWQREAGTQSEESANWMDGHQILTIQGNKFYMAGSSYLSGDDVGLGFALPTDGTGARDEYYDRYLYRETSWAISTSTSTVDVMEIGFQAAQVVATTTNTFTVTAITDNAHETRAVRTGLVNGRINDLYSVTFEDNTVQKTAYTGGLNPAGHSPLVYNTNNYYVNLSDAGKVIRWYADGWNDQVDIYVPHNDDAAFEIGTQIHFMKDQGIRELFFWPYADNNNDITIMPASPADYMTNQSYDSGEGWSVHHYDYADVPCIVTLTKVDTNRWLLSSNSQSHIMDWS